MFHTYASMHIHIHLCCTYRHKYRICPHRYIFVYIFVYSTEAKVHSWFILYNILSQILRLKKIMLYKWNRPQTCKYLIFFLFLKHICSYNSRKSSSESELLKVYCSISLNGEIALLAIPLKDNCKSFTSIYLVLGTV